MSITEKSGSLEILIVEDSPTQAQRLQHILEQQGFRVTAAANGRLAMEAARSRKPTLIISDVIMPEMDGYELCRRIKLDPSLSDVPVILVTTLSDPEDVIHGLECRADNFILKPYDERHLLNHVQFVLVNREMRQTERTGMGVEIFFNGQKHFITADRLQILNLLLSTYEAAMQRNKELSRTQDRLREANSALQRMALELESRVTQRTQELARSNEALREEASEREHAQQALVESHELLQAIIDNSTTVIYVKDLQGRYVLVNRRFSELFHLSQEAVVGQTDYEIFSRETADAFRAMDQRVAAAGHALTEEETAPHDDGPHTYISVKCPLRERTGKPYAVFGISTDITERKQAQEKLRAQFERLNLLDRTTRAISERQDLHSIFQVVLRSLEDHLPVDFGCMCLYEPAQESLVVTSVGVKSQPLALELALTDQLHIPVDSNGLSPCVHGQLVHEADLRNVPSSFAQRLARGGLCSLVAAPLLVESKVFGVLVVARREVRSFSSGDCEFLRQLSEHVALAAHQAQLYAALQQAYDDLRQTQQAAMQQERLRALGQMASGIAHDINNAISPAALYTESLLESEPNLSARGREYLGTIARAIDDVAATVGRMREFYRQREPELKLAPANLNRLVDQVVDLTRARWSDMPQQRGILIKMHTQLDPALPVVLGVESEIREALTNLIFNAVDAMPDGGTMTLRTSVAESAPALAENPAVRHVAVEIIDTGLGMDEDTRRRCLEPFFTTKGERGTGLGLAMVYGMARRHRAETRIESAVGKGTTVRLSFPLPATIVTERAEFETVCPVPSRLRILIVDDDPVLLKSLCDTLEAEGHVVVTANSGQAGIDAFQCASASCDPFEVVITDLGMPHLDGRKVASTVKNASPQTPVILLTGWGQGFFAEGNVPAHVDRVLDKPPKLRELRQALAHCCQTADTLRDQSRGRVA